MGSASGGGGSKTIAKPYSTISAPPTAGAAYSQARLSSKAGEVSRLLTIASFTPYQAASPPNPAIKRCVATWIARCAGIGKRCVSTRKVKWARSPIAMPAPIIVIHANAYSQTSSNQKKLIGSRSSQSVTGTMTYRRKTPTIRSPIARIKRPVSTIFGKSSTTSRTRHGVAGRSDAAAASFAVTAGSDLGCDDFFPELGELLLVGRPDFFLRQFAERVDIGGIHGHSLGFEKLLGLVEIVDALGQLAHLGLGIARGVCDQFALALGQPVPELEIDDRRGRPIIVIGHRAVFRHLIRL